MRSLNRYQNIHPYAVTKIRFHARQLIRYRCFSGMEIEDIEQELVLDYLRRIPLFDSSKSSLNTFIAQIVEKHSFKLIRHVCAQKRRNLMSLDTWRDDGDAHAALNLARNNCALPWDEHVTLTYDLQKVTATLPTPLIALCEQLKEKDVAELCGDNRAGKSAKYQAIQKIRAVFSTTDLKKYL